MEDRVYEIKNLITGKNCASGNCWYLETVGVDLE
jgi:hypothetical protein